MQVGDNLAPTDAHNKESKQFKMEICENIANTVQEIV